jgi:hypothetical protein
MDDSAEATIEKIRQTLSGESLDLQGYVYYNIH